MCSEIVVNGIILFQNAYLPTMVDDNFFDVTMAFNDGASIHAGTFYSRFFK